LDQPKHQARWLLKPQETFRIRFKVLEPESGQVLMTTDQDSRGVQHWVEFLMWDYAKLIELRKKATKYHNETRTFFVDTDLLNELKLKTLMKSWSFGEVDAHMKLQHADGILTDESWQLVKSMYPCLIQAVLDKMNAVLEGWL